MGAHFDQQEGDLRLKYSLVFYLNDDYEGGEISFTIRDHILSHTERPNAEDDPEKQKNIITFWLKPKAGSCLIFPAALPYSHTAHSVKSGFKYMSTAAWMTEIEPVNKTIPGAVAYWTKDSRTLDKKINEKN